MNKLSKLKQEYNQLLERINKAENFLSNIDLLRAAGKAPKDDMFYMVSYQKLVNMVNLKRQEIEKEAGQKMTTEEILKGF